MNTMKFILSIILCLMLVIACGKRKTLENKNDDGVVDLKHEGTYKLYLSGSGDDSQSTTLKRGYAKFKLESEASGKYRRNFIVWLKDYDGKNIKLLANDEDGYYGSNSVKIKKYGLYIIDVRSSGTWKITIYQR